MKVDTQSCRIDHAGNGRTGHGLKHGKQPYNGGDIDTARELPPPGTMRWGARSKAAVVLAVRQGLLSLDEACTRYALSTSEYLTWEYGLDNGGLRGLGLVGRQQSRRGFTHTDK